MSQKIDIIILSYAKNEYLKNLTRETVRTLLESEDPQKIEFNILVIESYRNIYPHQYAGTTTIYPDAAFGFNKFMNVGIRSTKHDYVCLCNNDLIFHKNWASEILKAMDDNSSISSASPYCTIFHKNNGFRDDGQPSEGYEGLLGGWCIFVKRRIFDQIGLFDENLDFWYCDNDYCQTLKKFGVKNFLIPASKVTHLGSESLNTMSDKEFQQLTQLPGFYYSYKWVHHSYLKYQIQKLLFNLRLLIKKIAHDR
jgi:GT2 family glycosyltransferase